MGTIHGYEEDEEDRSYQFYDKRCVDDYRNLSMGLGISEVKRRLEEDEKVFNVVKPEDLMENPLIPGRGSGCSASGLPPGDVSGKPTANSFTYSQKKKMKGKEQAQEESPNLKSERLDPAFAERLRAEQEVDGISWERRNSARKAWMKKLVEGDFSGPTLDRSRYLTLRGQALAGNPRQTEEYRKLCREAVGVGDKPDLERYAHLEPDDFDVIRWVVSRGSGCMWLPDTPRTTVKGFKHRLITRGPPVRGRLFRLNRMDTEWIEKAIDEDVKRGQLEKGNSDWGFPAFPTKANPTYKAIQRSRRMVVDYRALNQVTVRKFFLIPNSDYIKSTVAGNQFISVGDLKEGFNQVDNEPETRKKMAVLSAGGCWLPRGLTFGPTNGPEDFQELVFTVFQRRLYNDWFLFVDDLSVATGRKKCHGDGPSGAHDVSCAIERAETEGERRKNCRDKKSGQAFPSPFAHNGYLFFFIGFVLVWYLLQELFTCRCERNSYGVGGRVALGLDDVAAPRVKKEPEPKGGEREPGTTVRIKASRIFRRNPSVVRRWKGSVSLCLAQILAPPLRACSLRPSLLAHKGVASFELVMPSNPWRGPGRWQVEQYRGRTAARHHHHSRERGNYRDRGQQDEFYDR